MSFELYTPEDFDPPGVQFGHVSKCFSWAPDWYEGDWSNPDNQERLIAWLRAHPGAKVETDGRARDAAEVLEWIGPTGGTAGVTVDDLRSALVRYGRL